MTSLDFSAETDAFKEYYAANAAVFQDAANSLKTLLTLLLTDNDDFAAPTVSCRVKDCPECITKFARKYQEECEQSQKAYEIKDYIADVVGLRIVCLYEVDIPLVRSILVDNFELLGETDKSRDIKSKDDLFGYQGLHLDLELNESRRSLQEYKRFQSLRFEVQVRTIVQDAWSVLDHKIKYKRSIPIELRRRINRLAALFELADQEFLNLHKETREFESRAETESSTIHASDTARDATGSMVDAFSFARLVAKHFPKYPFHGEKIDSFVEDLLSVADALTAAEIDDALSNQKHTVEDYKQHVWQQFDSRMNPYTTIRHALYLHDRERFSRLLFNDQRTNVDAWRAQPPA